MLSKIDFELFPGKGLRRFTFGMTQEEVVFILGKPEETEWLDEEAEEALIDVSSPSYEPTPDAVLVYYYWDNYLTLFFSGEKHDKLTGIECDHDEMVLWDEKIYQKGIKFIRELLRSHKVFDVETIEEAWGEQVLSVESLGIDFYFEKDLLSSVNLSAWYDGNGVIVDSDKV